MSPPWPSTPATPTTSWSERPTAAFGRATTARAVLDPAHRPRRYSHHGGHRLPPSRSGHRPRGHGRRRLVVRFWYGHPPVHRRGFHLGKPMHCPVRRPGLLRSGVRPGHPTRLYAATTGGLFVSTDSGATWTRRRTVRTWSVAVAPSGAEALAACQDGLFRSTDRGVTWNAVTLPSAPATYSRFAVALAPSDPTVAYAWGAGTTGYLARRAGGTWTSIGAPTGVNIGQAWYDWFLAVAPDNAGQVYCGAISAHRGRPLRHHLDLDGHRQQALARPVHPPRPARHRLRTGPAPGCLHRQ